MSKETLKKVSPITPANFSVAESKRQAFYAVIPNGTSLEDIKSPMYFSNVIKQIKPFAHIEVVAEDGSYWAELLVTYCAGGSLKFEVINRIDIAQVRVAEEDLGDLVVKWGGPSVLWRVLRKSDNSIVKDKFEAKPDAVAWAIQHLRTIAA